MRNPGCVLVRVGEIALKSPQVQRKFFGTLLHNMKAALGFLPYKIETNPNRIFVYGDSERIILALKRVFGITSLSPAWTCFSGISEIKLLAVDIAEEMKLNPKNSFAVRARRSGRHKFSSQTIAEEVGAAIKRVTGAKVDLSNPDKEISIECRSRKTYIFTEKIKCEGGLPLGISGKVVVPLTSEKDAVAAWLMMKRGCEIIIIINEKNLKRFSKLVEGLKSWHIGSEMKIIIGTGKTAEEIAKSGVPIATGETAGKKIKKAHAFRPIFFLEKKEIDEIANKIYK